MCAEACWLFPCKTNAGDIIILHIALFLAAAISMLFFTT